MHCIDCMYKTTFVIQLLCGLDRKVSCKFKVRLDKMAKIPYRTHRSRVTIHREDPCYRR